MSLRYNCAKKCFPVPSCPIWLINRLFAIFLQQLNFDHEIKLLQKSEEWTNVVPSCKLYVALKFHSHFLSCSSVTCTKFHFFVKVLLENFWPEQLLSRTKVHVSMDPHWFELWHCLCTLLLKNLAPTWPQ
jgi:hypothetical protein